MRWAQTASYGVLPNPEMPNTFLAQAYDLNDPYAHAHAHTHKWRGACLACLLAVGLHTCGGSRLCVLPRTH